MSARPFQMIRQIAVTEIQGSPDQPKAWRYEAEWADTPNVSVQKDKLTILTHVSAPLPSHP